MNDNSLLETYNASIVTTNNLSISTNISIPNLPSHALTLLPKQSKGDPLMSGKTRPEAPEDPDVYDIELQNKEYGRSLIPEQEPNIIPIEQVRHLLSQNVSKTSDEISHIDPEILLLIDQNTDYKTFIVNSYVYSRKELYDNFPFHEFQLQPEAIFHQQEIAVFFGEKNEYYARDIGSDTEFMRVSDIIRFGGAACGSIRKPDAIVKTKCYIARELWDDFLVARSLARLKVRSDMLLRLT